MKAGPTGPHPQCPKPPAKTRYPAKQSAIMLALSILNKYHLAIVTKFSSHTIADCEFEMRKYEIQNHI
jgi:hypothetical protein